MRLITIALFSLSAILVCSASAGSVSKPNGTEHQDRIIEVILYVGKFPTREAEKKLPLSKEDISKALRGRFHVTESRIFYEAKLGKFDSYVDTGEMFSKGLGYEVEFMERDRVLRISRAKVIWLFHKEVAFSPAEKSAISLLTK